MACAVHGPARMGGHPKYLRKPCGSSVSGIRKATGASRCYPAGLSSRQRGTSAAMQAGDGQIVQCRPGGRHGTEVDCCGSGHRWIDRETDHRRLRRWRSGGDDLHDPSRNLNPRKNITDAPLRTAPHCTPNLMITDRMIWRKFGTVYGVPAGSRGPEAPGGARESGGNPPTTSGRAPTRGTFKKVGVARKP
jgi:hypothetical protein